MDRAAQLLGNFRFLPGPIIAVEMVTTARRKWHYVLRFLYPLALLFAVFTNYPSDYYGGAVTISMISDALARFFVSFGVMQILAVVLIGPAMAAGTIASERERRTIEYLFTTTLNNAEIILGKLSARVLSILYLILSGVPVLALAMLLGGISPQLLALLFVISFSTAIFVAVVSVSISVFSKRARDAVMSTYLVMIVFLVVAWILSVSVRWYVFGFTDVVNFLMVAHPLMTFAKIFEPISAVGSDHVWSIVLAMVRNQAIVAGLLLVFATAMMRRVHLRQAGAGVKRRRWRIRLFKGQLGDRPMLWKELWSEPAARLGVVGYAALGIVYATVVGFVCYWFYLASSPTGSWQQGAQRNVEYLWMSTALASTVACGGVLLIAARAACSVTSEKERECWESLISTPLEAREIVFAKILGSVWAIRAVVPLLLLAWLPAILYVPTFAFVLPIHFLTLGTISVYAAALGVRQSLGAKGSMRAMAITLSIGVFCGGGFLFCCMPCLAGTGLGEGAMVIFGACVPFLIAFPTSFATPEFWNNGGSRETSWMLMAYLAGNCLYAVAAFVLYRLAVDRFDRISGRSHPRHFLSRETTGKAEAEEPAVSSPLVGGDGVATERPID